MEPNPNNTHTNDLTALLQNMAFKPDNSENIGQSQYNNLMNVLISSIAKGGPKSFQIGNQTISVNIEQENKQVIKEKNEQKLELTNKQGSLVPIQEEEDMDEKETLKQNEEEKELNVDIEEEKVQIDINSLLNEITNTRYFHSDL